MARLEAPKTVDGSIEIVNGSPMLCVGGVPISMQTGLKIEAGLDRAADVTVTLRLDRDRLTIGPNIKAMQEQANGNQQA